jgi:flagellar biosynthesis protein FlhF
MNLKTFRGNSMADALMEVKKELGPHAVILHTRTLRVGGMLGVGKRSLVEITASDSEPGEPRSRPRPRVPTTRLPSTIPAPMPATVMTKAEQFIAGAPWSQSLTEDLQDQPTQPAPTRQSFHSEILNQSQPAATASPTGSAAPGVPVPVAPTARSIAADRRPLALDLHTPEQPDSLPSPKRESTTLPVAPESTAQPSQAHPPRTPVPTVRLLPTDAVEAELGHIKAMLGQVLRSTRSGANAVGALPSTLLDLYTTLIEQEVPDAIAETILGAARNELTPAELQSPEIVRTTVLRLIAARIAVTSDWPPRRHADRPAVVALVGPTGVGKTTTLAKLAAGLKLKRGLRVGLITCDTYRIAAVEQLRTYAEIIGVPLRVALSPVELRDGLTVLGDNDVILVDTAGRSQNDEERISELRALVEVARPDQTHLVLSATSSPGVLRRACDKFARLNPDRLLLTKVDEAVALGSILEVLEHTRLPMSFLSTGQEVPDHIECASAERLARRILPTCAHTTDKSAAVNNPRSNIETTSDDSGPHLTIAGGMRAVLAS